jgi:starch phosphorylase
LGDSKEHGDDPAWDAFEAEVLYTILEKEVIPEFYSRDPNGIPVAWVARIRESMGQLTPRFSANRTVREYTEQYYIPAAVAYRERAADRGAMGAQLMNWRRALEKNWSNLYFGEMKVASDERKHVFEVQIYLGGLDPNTVRVELYADGGDNSKPVQQEMMRGAQRVGTNSYVYSAQVPSTRPATDYTARVIPHRSGAAVPLEAPQILWQR